MSDASARIAARLLRGWTLTAERCPVARCGTPLMRERATDATFYCAGGDASVRLDDVEHGARSGAVDAWEAESDEDEDARDRDGARAREVGTSEEEDGDADDARSPSTAGSTAWSCATASWTCRDASRRKCSWVGR
jgi:uncharacterized Zn finger protein (UPF0148 family)